LFSLAWIVAPLKSERFSPVGQSALLIMLAIAVSPGCMGTVVSTSPEIGSRLLERSDGIRRF
jgi:hypothetical protein